MRHLSTKKVEVRWGKTQLRHLLAVEARLHLRRRAQETWPKARIYEAIGGTARYAGHPYPLHRAIKLACVVEYVPDRLPVRHSPG
jgi:hypothetical protein